MVPQYLETNELLYARISFVRFITHHYGTMDTDELATMVVLCNRMIARNPEIELMQLLLSETIYAKADGSGYSIPKLQETLQVIREKKLENRYTACAKGIQYIEELGVYAYTGDYPWFGSMGLSEDYLRYIREQLQKLEQQGWTIKKLLSVANKYPEITAALKEPDLRVWDDMHLLEASPDIPNLGELTDVQKELKYSQ